VIIIKHISANLNTYFMIFFKSKEQFFFFSIAKKPAKTGSNALGIVGEITCFEMP